MKETYALAKLSGIYVFILAFYAVRTMITIKPSIEKDQSFDATGIMIIRSIIIDPS